MHNIFAFFIGIAALFGIVPHTHTTQHQHLSVSKPVASSSAQPLIAIPSPTSSPSAIPVNPYKQQLVTQLTAQLNELDSEIAKWSDAIKYNEDAQKSMDKYTMDVINNGSNGQPVSPASLMDFTFAEKAQQARDEVYKLQYQRTQILLQLASAQ